MNRIDAAFQNAGKGRSRRVFVAYVTGGDPDEERGLAVLCAVADAGADIIEVGIPFSDPIADGPVIQAAFGRALQAGVTPASVLRIIEKFRHRHQTAVVLFTYYNPVLQYGVERFAADAAAAGADGVLLLDLPPEHAATEREVFAAAGLHSIVLVAPTTPRERMAWLAAEARGFVYYVSREGVTGERRELAADLCERVKLLKSLSSVPVVVGFGVSTPEHVRAVCDVADGVVVGSAIVRRVEEAVRQGEDPAKRAAQFCRPLAEEAHRELEN